MRALRIRAVHHNLFVIRIRCTNQRIDHDVDVNDSCALAERIKRLELTERRFLKLAVNQTSLLENSLSTRLCVRIDGNEVDNFQTREITHLTEVTRCSSNERSILLTECLLDKRLRFAGLRTTNLDSRNLLRIKFDHLNPLSGAELLTLFIREFDFTHTDLIHEDFNDRHLLRAFTLSGADHLSDFGHRVKFLEGILDIVHRLGTFRQRTDSDSFFLLLNGIIDDDTPTEIRSIRNRTINNGQFLFPLFFHSGSLLGYRILIVIIELEDIFVVRLFLFLHGFGLSLFRLLCLTSDFIELHSLVLEVFEVDVFQCATLFILYFIAHDFFPPM